MKNVYILQCGEFFKIGVANDVNARVRALQTGNPVEIRIVFSHEIIDRNVEKRLHKLFSDKRIRNEWFALTEKDIYDIIEVAKSQQNYIAIRQNPPLREKKTKAETTESPPAESAWIERFMRGHYNWYLKWRWRDENGKKRSKYIGRDKQQREV